MLKALSTLLVLQHVRAQISLSQVTVTSSSLVQGNLDDITNGVYEPGENYPTEVYGNCATTDQEDNPWFHLSSTVTLDISTVMILAKNSADTTEISGLQVFIGNDATDYYKNTLCPQEVTQSGFYDCQLSGTEVWLRQRRKDRTLTICQVTLYEEVNIIEQVEVASSSISAIDWSSLN